MQAILSERLLQMRERSEKAKKGEKRHPRLQKRGCGMLFGFVMIQLYRSLCRSYAVLLGSAAAEPGLLGLRFFQLFQWAGHDVSVQDHKIGGLPF